MIESSAFIGRGWYVLQRSRCGTCPGVELGNSWFRPRGCGPTGSHRVGRGSGTRRMIQPPRVEITCGWSVGTSNAIRVVPSSYSRRQMGKRKKSSRKPGAAASAARRREPLGTFSRRVAGRADFIGQTPRSHVYSATTTSLSPLDSTERRELRGSFARCATSDIRAK